MATVELRKRKGFSEAVWCAVTSGGQVAPACSKETAEYIARNMDERYVVWSYDSSFRFKAEVMYGDG